MPFPPHPRRILRLALAIAVVALPLSTRVLQAQDDTAWSSRGPFCSRAFGLVAEKGLQGPAYLAVGGRLFHSTDGWASWSRVGVELPDSHLSAVAMAPTNGRLVYFAPWDGGGVFRSRDGGETWGEVFRDLPDPLVHELTVPPAPIGTVYAVAPYTGIYRSRDRGENWLDVSPPEPGSTGFLSLVAHPYRPERVIATTVGGLWRSTDGGTTWREWTAGLPRDFQGDVLALSNVTLAPSAREVAFVVAGSSIFRSDEGGRWRRMGAVEPLESAASALAAGPGRQPVLLAGQVVGTSTTPSLLRSRDGGKTWHPLSLLGESIYRLAYLPATGRFTAMTASGAFYSSDLGTTWHRTGQGIAAARVRSLAVADRRGRVLVAGLETCPGGVARSRDGGATWHVGEVREPGVRYGSMSEVRALAPAPSRPSRLYAGVMDTVLRSDDGGVTWVHNEFRDGLTGGWVSGLAVHPIDPDLVFAAGDHGLQHSRDAGITWSGRPAYPLDRATAVAFDPQHPERMLATSSAGGIFRSTDTGATWQLLPGTDGLHAGALAFDPRDPSIVLATSPFAGEGIFRSVDGGETWVASAVGTDGVISSLLFSPEGGEAFAAGTAGIFRSADGGKVWQPVAGAPAGVTALVAGRDGVYHAGTNHGVMSGVPEH
jgi:photosystem II stability/assembly factor-like uncharacterized protein